jgi:hypothetical protein
MTLILGAADATAAVLAADRRVSRDGAPVDDETTKATVVFTPDARIAIGFTGIARRSNFTVEEWLPDTVTSLAKGIDSIYQLLPRLREETAQMIDRVDPEGSLSIVAVGYAYGDESTPHPVGWTIACTEGTAELVSHAGPAVQIAAGSINRRVQAHVDRFHANFPASGTREALWSLAAHTIKRASSESRMISPLSNVVVIPPRPNSVVASAYYVAKAEHSQHAANCVISTGENATMTSGGVLLASRDGVPVSFPPTKRNDPCPCGSGMKYKRCHQRLKYAYLPIRTEVENNEPAPSGERFILECTGAWGIA